MVFGEGLDFVESGCDVDFGELVRTFLHVLQRKVIGFEQLEVVDAQLHDASDLEVAVDQVPSLRFVLVLLPL